MKNELKEVFNLDSQMVGVRPTENVFPLYLSVDSPNHRLNYFASDRTNFKDTIKYVFDRYISMGYRHAETYGYSNHRVCFVRNDAVLHPSIASKIEWLRRLYAFFKDQRELVGAVKLLDKAEEMQFEDFMHEIDQVIIIMKKNCVPGSILKEKKEKK